MPKRKRNAPKKQPEFESCGLPSELWNQIVSGLDLPGLVKCVCLGPANHWLSFYVKYALEKKKLFGIHQAMYDLSLLYPIRNIPITKPGTGLAPAVARDLFNCFSNGNPIAILPHVIADMLKACVIYFLWNKRELSSNFFSIYDRHGYYDPGEPGFHLVVKIVFPVSEKRSLMEFSNRTKFLLQEYTIRIYQVANRKGKFNSVGIDLFSFFNKFKFKVELYKSTYWGLKGTQNAVFFKLVNCCPMSHKIKKIKQHKKKGNVKIK